MDPPLQEPTTTPVAEPSPATTTTPPPEAATTTTTTDMASSVSSSPSASPSPQVPSGQPEVDIRPGNPLVRFIIGFFLITASSVANSLGLNLMKLDHMRAESNPGAYSKHEYLRPMWLAGITSYVLSQLVGSTLALQYLRAEFVAPLGSSSLVFNVIFANWLIGTPITNADVRGTGFIVLGVILILVFASINSGLSTSLSLNRLYALWGRPGFLVFLITQILLLCFAWAVIISFSRILANRTSDIDELDFSKAQPHPRVPKFLHPVYYAHLRFTIALNSYLSAVTHRSSDARLAFLVGIGWASIGGTLAGGSLVFAKAVVMIGMGEGNIYFHPTPLLTIVLLAACAVLQMIALNRGLKAFDSTLIVPVFYAGYTLMGFLDSMIFLNQVGAYSWTILFLICVGVGVLLYGVALLSTKKESSLPTETTASDNPSNPDDLESGDGLSAAGTGTASDLHPLPARKRSQSTGTQGSIPEEREALFDADAEERFQARGEDGQPRGGVGKWEVGSDSEEDEVEEDKGGDKEEERRPVLEGRTTNARSVASIGKGGRRRSLNGSLGEEDPWKDA